ncbi:hypothetical protein HN014_10880 [Aquimarina sp. TRL1]|uniref:hypothetical protein n=1 Tax=Aquimarina sp. (strain TRL1) TaxID=2736252 RepID=UPI00158D16F9|nr:hypothetical protein [Aquimarina sp. TRL1]QKX05397.1 hypothetical protein HN014_10880 [Aquimarina sp. TRL1]
MPNKKEINKLLEKAYSEYGFGRNDEIVKLQIELEEELLEITSELSKKDKKIINCKNLKTKKEEEASKFQILFFEKILLRQNIEKLLFKIEQVNINGFTKAIILPLLIELL